MTRETKLHDPYTMALATDLCRRRVSSHTLTLAGLHPVAPLSVVALEVDVDWHSQDHHSTETVDPSDTSNGAMAYSCYVVTFGNTCGGCLGEGTEMDLDYLGQFAGRISCSRCGGVGTTTNVSTGAFDVGAPPRGGILLMVPFHVSGRPLSPRPTKLVLRTEDVSDAIDVAVDALTEGATLDQILPIFAGLGIPGRDALATVALEIVLVRHRAAVAYTIALRYQRYEPEENESVAELSQDIVDRYQKSEAPRMTSEAVCALTRTLLGGT